MYTVHLIRGRPWLLVCLRALIYPFVSRMYSNVCLHRGINPMLMPVTSVAPLKHIQYMLDKDLRRSYAPSLCRKTGN